MAIRPTVTSMEALIMPKIKTFLEGRSAQLAKKKKSTPEEGTDMLAEAIAMGIAEAFNHPAFDSAAALIVDIGPTPPPAPVPIGTLSRAAFKTAALVPAVPNPNLSRPY
jgi:hypothetical protein